ncbi:MAG TPA: hypothetical protein VJL29_04955 [Thermoguttaceae bacterium]|nr:hypothetical protein [Thermoguttaceae bacterium]
MSLLEVLIAMAIITLGLLGLAALVPMGHFAVVESTKADRSSACGRAAVADVKTRRLLDPNLWAAFSPSISAEWHSFSTTNTPEVAADLYYGDAVVIDPQFVSNNHPNLASGDVGHLAAFPYGIKNPTDLDWKPCYLDRLAFRGLINNPLLPAPAAAQLFTWADDLVYETESRDSDARTRSVYLRSTGEVSAVPPFASPDDRLRQERSGNYSWLMTLLPSETEGPLNPTARRTYGVSVAVFFRRDLDYQPADSSNPPTAENMPTERLAKVVFTGGGYGGGDATIYVPTVDGANWFGLKVDDKKAYAAYLNVRKDQWILVMGLKPDTRLSSFSRPSQLDDHRRVAQWYRVVAVDEVQRHSEVAATEITTIGSGNDAYYRRVTLAGPDWDANVWDPTLPASPAPTTITAAAVLIDDVIGVYTKTIELDE